LLIFWSLLVDIRCWTPVTVRNKWSFSVLINNAKNTKKKGAKGSFPWFSWTLACPGKPLARLGELQLPQSDLLPINRRPRGCFKGFQGKKIEGIERRKKEEEERRGNKARRYRIATAINLYIVPCSVFFVWPSVSFVFFKILMWSMHR